MSKSRGGVWWAAKDVATKKIGIADDYNYQYLHLARAVSGDDNTAEIKETRATGASGIQVPAE